jgi:hypothetical protein
LRLARLKATLSADSTIGGSVLDKRLGAFTASDIQQLVSEGTTESRTLEFKSELPGNKDSDRKEFLGDVSSFANAAGGDIVYGVTETAGRATAADGVAVENVDTELLRLDQLIRSGISPRIVGFHIQPVPGLTKGPAMVIRVQRSWQGPHIVSYQGHFRFFSRNAAGKFPMDVSDIRDAVLNAGSTEQRIRLFRSDRLARIGAGEMLVQLEGTKVICIHVVPFEAFAGSSQIDLMAAANHSQLLAPFYSYGWSAPTFNIDGIYVHAPRSNRTTSGGYVQCLRNGVIEAVDAEMLPSPENHPDAVPAVAFPQTLFSFAKRVMELYRILSVEPPYAFLLSFVGARGVVLGVDEWAQLRLSLHPIDRDVLMIPETVIDTHSFDPDVLLKPVLDALWQSFGSPACFYYNEQGRWNPQAAR